MGSVFLFLLLFVVVILLFLLFCRFFGLADFALWTLIGSRPDDTLFVVSRTV